MTDAREFELYDLRVEVVEGPRPMVCNHAAGDTFHGAHLATNLEAVALALADLDRAELEAATARLTDLAGDVFGLEREAEGPHARIMWKNLSQAPD